MDEANKKTWGIVIFGFIALIVVSTCARIPAVADFVAAVLSNAH